MTEPLLKEQHEIAIGGQLLNSLRMDARFLGHGSDGVEPDLIYQIGNRRIGIEIATAYYNDRQAKVEWQLARGKVSPDPSGFTPILRMCDFADEPHKLIASRVQQELDDKCLKVYSGVDSAWLCIEQRAQLTDVSETLKLISKIKIPAGHSFERIYLCSYAHVGDGGGFKVYALSSA